MHNISLKREQFREQLSVALARWWNEWKERQEPAVSEESAPIGEGATEGPSSGDVGTFEAKAKKAPPPPAARTSSLTGPAGTPTHVDDPTGCNRGL